MSTTTPPRHRWRSPEVASHYATTRFDTARARERDPRLIERLLRRDSRALAPGRVLDIPCGTGRLAPSLSGQGGYVGADVSSEMLRHAPPPRVLADAAALPFADGSFELVVCCRLLHHLDRDVELPTVVNELVRVSSCLVLASFWDAASIPAWRRRLGLRRRSGRRPIAKRDLEACFAAAGARIVDYAHSARFFSMQTFAAARVER